ncbi:MAG: nuclease A inhibitor family protein [Oscillochloridaceae bacterium umkhey_bin13]
MSEVLRQFEPLLQALAAVANGDEGPREELIQVLGQLERQGWMLRGPVERIWAGERERGVLVAGLDAQDTALIEHLLGLLSTNHQETTMPPASSAALAAITTAAEGLWMPSETDAPFDPFAWPGPDPLTPAALLAALDLPADTVVAQADALALLDSLAADQDWFGDQERATAARFAALRDTMTSHLTELTLYRLGQIRITLMIVGRDGNGLWVGLKTFVVET